MIQLRSLPAVFAVGGLLATGVVSYLLWGQIKANGELEARVDEVEQANQQWAQRFEAMEKRQQKINELDAELATFRAQQRETYQGLATDLRRLRDEMPEVREWAGGSAPAPMVDSLCERNVLTREARARLCPDPSALPGAVPGAEAGRGDQR